MSGSIACKTEKLDLHACSLPSGASTMGEADLDKVQRGVGDLQGAPRLPVAEGAGSPCVTPRLLVLDR